MVQEGNSILDDLIEPQQSQVSILGDLLPPSPDLQAGSGVLSDLISDSNAVSVPTGQNESMRQSAERYFNGAGGQDVLRTDYDPEVSQSLMDTKVRNREYLRSRGSSLPGGSAFYYNPAREQAAIEKEEIASGNKYNKSMFAREMNSDAKRNRESRQFAKQYIDEVYRDNPELAKKDYKARLMTLGFESNDLTGALSLLNEYITKTGTLDSARKYVEAESEEMAGLRRNVDINNMVMTIGSLFLGGAGAAKAVKAAKESKALKLEPETVNKVWDAFRDFENTHGRKALAQAISGAVKESEAAAKEASLYADSPIGSRRIISNKTQLPEWIKDISEPVTNEAAIPTIYDRPTIYTREQLLERLKNEQALNPFPGKAREIPPYEDISRSPVPTGGEIMANHPSPGLSGKEVPAFEPFRPADIGIDEMIEANRLAENSKVKSYVKNAPVEKPENPTGIIPYKEDATLANIINRNTMGAATQGELDATTQADMAQQMQRFNRAAGVSTIPDDVAKAIASLVKKFGKQAPEVSRRFMQLVDKYGIDSASAMMGGLSKIKGVPEYDVARIEKIFGGLSDTNAIAKAEGVVSALKNTPVDNVNTKLTQALDAFDGKIAEKAVINPSELYNTERHITDFFRQTFTRGLDWVEKTGPSGKQISESIRTIAYAADRDSSRHIRNTKSLLKGLSKEERANVGLIINNSPSAREIAQSRPDLEEIANKVRDMLDVPMKIEQDMGRVRGGRLVSTGGAALPQIPNKLGRKMLASLPGRTGATGAKLSAYLDEMIAKKQATDRMDALEQLYEFRDGALRYGGGDYSYFTKKRITLPEAWVEWDPIKVMERHQKTAFTQAYMDQVYGLDKKGLSTLLANLANETSPQTAETVKRYLEITMGFGKPLTTAATQKVWNALRTIMVHKTLGLGNPVSPMMNLSQPLLSALQQPGRMTIRAAVNSSPIFRRILKTFGIDDFYGVKNSSAIRGSGLFDQIANGQGVSGKLGAASLSLQTASEHHNHAVAALAARYGLERDINKLANYKEGSGLKEILKRLYGMDRASIEQRVRNSTILPMTDEELAQAVKAGRFTPSQIDQIMYRAVNDTQFPNDVAVKLMWQVTSPAASTLLLYKPFQIQQLGMIYRQVVRQALRGNFAPLGRYLVRAAIVGEVSRMAQDTLFGTEKSMTKKILNNPEQRTFRNILTGVAKNIVSGSGMLMLADWTEEPLKAAMGPLGAMIEDTMKTAVKFVASPKYAPRTLASFARQQVRSAQTASTIYENVGQSISQEMRRKASLKLWAGRAAMFNELIKGEIGDSQYKQMDPPITEKTVPYHAIEQYIQEDDPYGAAEYIRAMLAGKSPKEKKKTIDGIKASVRTPLEMVPKAYRDRFLKQYHEYDRKEFLRLSADMEKTLKKAIIVANKR